MEPGMNFDTFFDEQRKIRLLSAKEWDKIPWDTLRAFLHFTARYGLPTQELIAWLKEKIGNRSALEIGAGAGDLGYHLGIPMTDDHQQQDNPLVADYYKKMSQPPIVYGKDVEKIDALAAVEKYEPEVVIGCWITHYIDPDLPPPPGGGNIWGVREREIVQLADYILIGTPTVHRYKKIMDLPHKEINAPFARSRNPINKIWVWKKQTVKDL
jgi:hypothetical protein